MYEKSRVPHRGWTFEACVRHRPGDLSQRPCGYGHEHRLRLTRGHEHRLMLTRGQEHRLRLTRGQEHRLRLTTTEGQIRSVERTRVPKIVKVHAAQQSGRLRRGDALRTLNGSGSERSARTSAKRSGQMAGSGPRSWR